MLGTDPGLDHHRNGRILHPDHVHLRLRLCQHVLMLLEHVHQHRMDAVRVLRVGHIHLYIYPPDAVRGEIDDGIAPDTTIGHDQHLVVDGRNGGGQQVHAFDDPFCTGDLDAVVYIVGAVHEDHRSCREISERVLDCQPDEDANDAQTCKYGAQRHPQCGERDDQPQQEYSEA